MIRSFKSRRTEDLFAGKDVRDFRMIRKIAERKLVYLDSAVSLMECFIWEDNGPHNVEIVDYH
jgi:plasmid maintenance system killer protein